MDLKSFLVHPVEQVRRFRMLKSHCEHLTQIIRQHHLEIACTTEGRSSAYTLICTKTRWDYESRDKQYRSDIALMKNLISFAVPQDQLLTRLRTVVALAEGTS